MLRLVAWNLQVSAGEELRGELKRSLQKTRVAAGGAIVIQVKAMAGCHLFIWPQWLLINWFVAPARRVEQRQHEYDADAAVSRAGFRDGMRAVLLRSQPFEPPRNRWEAVVLATHPPTELRIERLEAA